MNPLNAVSPRGNIVNLPLFMPHAKIRPSTAEVENRNSTGADSHPLTRANDSAMINMNKVVNSTTDPGRSKRPFLLPGRALASPPRNHKIAAVSRVAPIGIRAQNIAGHPNSSPRTPPPNVPTKAPAPIADSVTPSAAPRLAGPNALATSAGPRVNRIATPTPCGIRRATIGARESCNEISPTARVYRTIPAINGHLIPNLSATPPAMNPVPLRAP